MEDWIFRFPLNADDELRADVRDALEQAGVVPQYELEGGHFPVLRVHIPDGQTLTTLCLLLSDCRFARCITRIPRSSQPTMAIRT